MGNKIPSFPFYPGDWVQDCYSCTFEEEGAWIRILCILHHSPTRGILTQSFDRWAISLRTTKEKAEQLINTLALMSLPQMKRLSNGDVTLSSRRMIRQEIERKHGRERVKNFRMKRNSNGRCNTLVQAPSSSSSSSSLLIHKKRVDTNPLGAGLTETEIPIPPLMVFPVRGNGTGGWGLKEEKLKEYQKLYANLEVLQIIKQARQWCIDNPSKRKTERGMTAFLGAWLSREAKKVGNKNLVENMISNLAKKVTLD